MWHHKGRIGELKATYLCAREELPRNAYRGRRNIPRRSTQGYQVSIDRQKAEKYPGPDTEEVIERYWKEVKQDTEGYDSIDIHVSNDNEWSALVNLKKFMGRTSRTRHTFWYSTYDVCRSYHQPRGWQDPGTFKEMNARHTNRRLWVFIHWTNLNEN